MTQPETPETVHACPPKGQGVTACCGRTPFELLRTGRMTMDATAVTCDTAIRTAAGQDQPTTEQRAKYGAAIRPIMLLGLQSADLSGPGGTQCINEWADWIADTLAAVRDEEMDRLRAELAQARGGALTEAADSAENVAESLRKQHQFERSTGALDAMTELRRMTAELEGDAELVCVDECGSCDACGMEPFGTPAEGWREAARFLRRTGFDSADYSLALRGAHLIEDELRRMAAEAQQDTQPEEQPPVHLRAGANAEDCPACEGTNPPYPFICPGPNATEAPTS